MVVMFLFHLLLLGVACFHFSVSCGCLLLVGVLPFHETRAEVLAVISIICPRPAWWAKIEYSPIIEQIQHRQALELFIPPFDMHVIRPQHPPGLSIYPRINMAGTQFCHMRCMACRQLLIARLIKLACQ